MVRSNYVLMVAVLLTPFWITPQSVLAASGSLSASQSVVDDVPQGLSAGDWSVIRQAYLKASNTETEDRFGFSVAVSGDTVVVGAVGEDSAGGIDGDPNDNSVSFAGAAYVFVRDGTSWVQQAYLKASNPDTNDAFGQSVAVSGNTIVIGAPGEQSSASGVNGNQSDNGADDAGAVYVFTRNGTTWTQQAYLKASNTDGGDWFGFSVAVEGDTLVVGAIGEASVDTGLNGDQSSNGFLFAGAVYVFTRDETTWSQQAYLKASNTNPSDRFGCSVGLSDSTMVVGAYLEASGASGVNGNANDNSLDGAGAAYVFVRGETESKWRLQAYLKASNTDAADRFGEALAISGDMVVVGANLEDSGATGVNGDQTDNSSAAAGAAYVFTRNGTTWSQQAYLKASNTDAFDRFGEAVAIAGDTILIAAPLEHSSTTGVNGDQSDNSTPFAGAVYAFQRRGTIWRQSAYLKASNAGEGDIFGRSVAVAGNTMVIGADWEDSAATGVNGDQNDDSATDSGAAYVFQASPWTDLGYALAGTKGLPVLTGSGTLLPGTPASLELSSAAPNAPALLLISTTSSPKPFLGGTLIPVPAVDSLAVVTDGSGESVWSWTQPSETASGTTLYLQCVIQDPVATLGAALSNAVRAQIP